MMGGLAIAGELYRLGRFAAGAFDEPKHDGSDEPHERREVRAIEEGRFPDGERDEEVQREGKSAKERETTNQGKGKTLHAVAAGTLAIGKQTDEDGKAREAREGGLRAEVKGHNSRNQRQH